MIKRFVRVSDPESMVDGQVVCYPGGAIKPRPVSDDALDLYRKRRLTRAARVEGPFECEAADGNVASCDDGWLCIDAAGYPYPVNATEFAKTYERVSDDVTHQT